MQTFLYPSESSYELGWDVPIRRKFMWKQHVSCKLQIPAHHRNTLQKGKLERGEFLKSLCYMDKDLLGKSLSILWLKTSKWVIWELKSFPQCHHESHPSVTNTGRWLVRINNPMAGVQHNHTRAHTQLKDIFCPSDGWNKWSKQFNMI